jgi:hypothetical protein
MLIDLFVVVPDVVKLASLIFRQHIGVICWKLSDYSLALVHAFYRF